ncbi:hypothetical protein KAR91_52185 [Candidatus Pacearchaeota archaeon]|nr:hypothetical protein [Candidatus Pacearchaeota archaeon]
MSYQEDLENEIRELKNIIGRKNNKIEKLKTELRKSEIKFSSAEWKIDHELKPRIESEKCSYDSWVTSPESHMSEDEAICYHFCETDQCGVKCPLFGDIPECTENLTDEELLKDYIENDGVEEVIFDRGLWFKKLKIDWSEDTRSIKVNRKMRREKFFWNIKSENRR